MGKATKQTKKFQKNHLKRAIDDRRNHQKKKAQVDRAKKTKELRASQSRAGRFGLRDGDADDDDADDDDDDAAVDEDDDDDAEGSSAPFKGMSVEDFLGGGFKAGMDEDEDEEDEDEDGADADDLSEIDDMSEDEGHAQDLAKLKEKDPEFYKYLQENDEELLRFGGSDGSDDDEEEEDEDMEDGESVASSSDVKGKGKAVGGGDDGESTQTVVTAKLLRSWQKAMLQHHSLKALRKVLLSFRAAAHMNDAEDADTSPHAFVVEEASVFNKLIMTTLKYTPVVLQHHIPAKESASGGKFKLPTNSKKFALLQRPIQTYFSNLHHLLKTIPEAKTLYVAVTESAKMVPFVMNNRRMAREYAKTMMELWATAADDVRIAAFLSLRKVARAGDEAMLDLCLRGAYHAFVRSTKLTTMHTLPSINLMKNSGSELYSLDSGAAYQQAFSFIRQLAIHLRNALKTKSADAFKSVYNWQYLHCVDFWSLVLSTACDKTKTEARGGGENELHQLIYPLVQVASGAIKLIPTSRHFPLRMHLLRSMLRLMQRTQVYIPLGPFLLEMLAAPEFMRKAKGSTLKPLDFSTTLRAPQSYVRTRVYADQLSDEVPHLLLEYLATQSRSIAFPELVVPLAAQMKRTLKHGTSQKLSAACKQLLAKVDANAKWIAAKRRDVDFAPNNVRGVNAFLADLDEKAETPLESALRLARKVREQKRQVVEMSEQRV